MARIAVIGGGIAGITAAEVLSQAHEVTLFEASPRLGGHAHSVALEDGGIELDTAFLIFNDGSYPQFLRLLRHWGVADAVVDTDMSMSFSNRNTGREYAVNQGARGLFAQPGNALRPAFWRLLAEIRRFRADAGAFVDEQTTLAEYARRGAFSPSFAQDFLYPMGAAVWSLPHDSLPRFPAELFFRFFAHHKALKVEQGARWKTLAGGSGQYVRAFARKFRGQIALSTPIASVARAGAAVEVRRSEGAVERFDQAVIATHADQALRLLATPSDRERNLLGAWRYAANPTYLHRDATVMPKARAAWASWNIGYRDGAYGVTYHLNRIQKPITTRDYFISFGTAPIAPETVLQRFDYRHPIFEPASLATQTDLRLLNQAGGIRFCGSYFGNGFHEAAIVSALAVAEQGGVRW